MLIMIYYCLLSGIFLVYTAYTMESNEDTEHQMMIEDSVPQVMQIDSKRQRFPCCIVWTPLPVLSWLVPFIGHAGICREDGVILDFAGPNFVCVDNFSFGSVARYIQLSKEKCCISRHPASQDERDLPTWDNALHNSTREYQHLSYNLLTCNCHSFVANTLNRLGFRAGGWNVVNLAALIFLKVQWVDTASIIRSFLPFVIVFGVGNWDCNLGIEVFNFLGVFYDYYYGLVPCWYLLFQDFNSFINCSICNFFTCELYFGNSRTICIYYL